MVNVHPMIGLRFALRRGSWSFLALAFAAPLLGCSDPQGGTDVGNAATVDFDVKAYEQLPTQKAQSLTLGDGARVDGLWMVIDRVRLVPGASCDEGSDSQHVDIPGPLVADLVAGGLVTGPVAFPVNKGAFCKLKVGLHKLGGGESPAGAPADLAGLSILMKGARLDGVAFTVRADLSEDLDLSATQGSFDLPAGRSPLFLAYEIGSWMTALELDQLPGPGPLVVDKQNNADSLDAFQEAVKSSARLFKDQNDDGDLSETEHGDGEELAD